MDVTRATSLMARQQGLAHTAQLCLLGMADSQIAARVASGSWALVAPDVVMTSGAPTTATTRVWRAVLAAGIRSDGRERPVAVGGVAAATLQGVDLSVPDTVELVVARGVWCPRPEGARVREVKDWAQRRFVRIEGLLVTALPDTLVDVAPYLGDADFLGLLQDQCFGRFALLGRVLARCHRGSKGSARARRVGALLAAGLDSSLHARGVATLRRAGLSPLACGMEAVPGAGPSDCLYLVDGRPVLALEFDGDMHRLSRKAFLHDRAKDLALREAGCGTLRFTIEQVGDPRRMVADVRRALQLAVRTSTVGVA